ncbi:MAG: hypothetical protein MHPDNHAH_00506 [Anaerolineales bacterium]|nr:hypothetical protein [Anaerolineales bacterium]WKZ43129.1 MAG: hypothetical protein QY302_13590 [Anaerolineales bacterium]WKZ49457.1 MAG: hypothetical protein QY306_08805 [Anaerolineales bacterium]
MQSNSAWSQWVEALKRLKLDGLALWLLEAGAPLAALGAQALYAAQPFIGGKEPNRIAHMLENEEELQAFARLLRGEAVT